MSSYNIKAPKKLIEVALPLDNINAAAAREKSIRHGHPSTLHLWWARRPLAAARAVLFAQMVNDPGGERGYKAGKTKAQADVEREKLFQIIRELVLWENTNNETVLAKARAEIWKSWRETCEMNKGKEGFDPDKLPAFHDPFAGGGAIPLEAQRLGLEAYASDLNPVAVMINKAMIEIPPKFAGTKPVGPLPDGEDSPLPTSPRWGEEFWPGATGLAEDVRRYGHWMREEAIKRIGHLYPKVEVTPGMAKDRPDLKQYVGQKLTVIAWLWARTVKSPNPAFSHVDVPLVKSFVLSSKKGKEAWVEPIVEGDRYRFEVRVGMFPNEAKEGTKAARGANFKCLMSQTPIKGEYIKSEGMAENIGQKLLAIVAEGTRGRVYLSPNLGIEELAKSATPTWWPNTSLPDDLRNFWTVSYGLDEYGKLFTPRQLVALTTFSDLVLEARKKVIEDYGGGNNIWIPTPVPDGLLRAARALRKNMTTAEQVIWQCLRGKQLAGFKFRRQHPIDRFVLDFYCHSTKLAIELDGSQHGTKAGKDRDAERTAWLEAQGIQVLRFWNYEVFENLEAVLTKIWETLEVSPQFFPLPQPSPAGGGGKSASDGQVSFPPSEGQTSLPPAGGGQEGGEATAYADAVAVYLAFAVDKAANLWSTITSWMNDRGAFRETFARQAIPMVWDFAEANPFCDAGGNFLTAIEKSKMAIQHVPANNNSYVNQSDAQTQTISLNKIVSTDPPYYDNIGYADLSDFFYVWLRRSLKSIYPDLFSTMAVPKAEELVATPYRHGNKQKAEVFFLNGMTQAIHNLTTQAHSAFPVTIYYAFKQSETKNEGTASTGWETFLEAVLRAGFAITGTWPVRTEGSGRMIGQGTNALASSIVLVCRQRDIKAETISRRQFQRELREEMPIALETMIGGKEGAITPIAPVDLAQAAIGPGMAIFSQYEAVLNQDGTPMGVHDALILINREITEFLSPESGSFDNDTLFCSSWFEQYGWSTGLFGEADTLARAKGTSVDGVKNAGVIESGGGKVKLLKWNEYPFDWEPESDQRTPVWEACHQLIRALKQLGESGAGTLLARMSDKSEPIRQLAYHLYTLCERKKWAEDARAYNELITSWHEIMAVSHEIGHSGVQLEMAWESST